MKALCRIKYQQTMADNELRRLQQHIAHYSSPAQSFDCSFMCPVAFIDSIQKMEMRQQLLAECRSLAEQSRTAMFALTMETAEAEKNDYKKKYDEMLKTMWSERHVSPANEKMSIQMIDLIEKRCKKIDERIECIYKFKNATLTFDSRT